MAGTYSLFLPGTCYNNHEKDNCGLTFNVNIEKYLEFFLFFNSAQ